MKQRLAFQKGDLLAIALVILLAIATTAVFTLSGNNHGSLIVQIRQDGHLMKELSLETDAVFQIEGEYTCIVTVSGEKVAITESDCPGRDCVHSGWISKAGRSIVCLPNRLEVRISGTSDVDFVVR